MRKYEKTIPARSGSHLGLSCLVSGDRTRPERYFMISVNFSLIVAAWLALINWWGGEGTGLGGGGDTET